MICLELCGGLQRGRQAGRGERREERRGDGRVDLAAADAQAVLTATVDDVGAGAVIAGRAVAAAVVHRQAAAAMATDRQPLQQRGALPHGATATGMMRPRPHILRQPLLVGLEGLPVDEAGVMVADEHRPVGARPQSEAFAQAAAVIEVTALLGAAIDVDASIERVGEDLMDLGVGRRHPADLGKRVRLQREAQALGAEPQPHAPCRAQLGKAFKDGADRGGDRLVRMQQHFAVRCAPHQPDR